MKTVRPTTGTVVKEISTHVATRQGNAINIYELGLKDGGLFFPCILIDSIPSENEEDLFAIFERLEENNRCLMAEFKSEIV